MAKTTEDYKFSSVLDLHNDEDAALLIASHDSVVEYYKPQMEIRERCHDFAAGNHWTEEEIAVAYSKRKALIEFNGIKTSERTFIGSIIQQRYDIKPAPREPTDQDKSDVYTSMYHWTADVTDVRYKDPGLVRDAWAGGNGWQEAFVEITPGRKPRIHVENQNPFAIYPDPNRRDLVSGSDCEFIDRDSWMSRAQLCDAIPSKEDEIRDALPNDFGIKYENNKVYADRAHEWSNARNGKYRVIERFYKVRQKMWFGVKDGDRMDIGYDVPKDSREAFQKDYPDHELHVEKEEHLYLAIVCPSMGTGYLYNGPYHCQPRDPVTQRVMFPFIELVDEDIDGNVSGHVQPQIGPQRMRNSLLVNKLFAAKNAAGQSHVSNPDAFDPDVLEDIEANLHDGGRVFPKKPGNTVPGTGIDLVQMGQAAKDGDDLIAMASSFQDEVSSTPPSMKGFSEGNVAGVLNDQRIQQSFIQSQGFTNNYMLFLTKRAKLWKYYWKEYFTAQDVIRVLEKKDPNDPDWIEVNKIIQDEWGNVGRQNSLDDGDAYDITFEDSWRSPTVRDKVRQQITQLLANPAVQQDPGLAAYLTYYFLQLSDAPQELKALVKEHSQVIKQQEQERQAAEAQQTGLDQAEQMQNMSTKEAQAMGPKSPNGAAMPPTPPQANRPSPDAMPSTAPRQQPSRMAAMSAA